MSNWNYRPETEPPSAMEMPEGDYPIKIINVTEGYTKNNKRMITVDVVAKGFLNITLHHRIVEGAYFNYNATQFFDCFNIERGNFETYTWVGARGNAHIAKGEPNAQGKRYMEIAYLILPNGNQAANFNTPQNRSGQQYSAPPVQQQQQPLYAHQKAQNQQGGYNPPPQPTDNSIEVFPDDIPF